MYPLCRGGAGGGDWGINLKEISQAYGLCLCAVGYLQSKQLRNRNRAAQHRSIVLAAARPLLETALVSDAGRGASPAGEDVTPPDWPGPSTRKS